VPFAIHEDDQYLLSTSSISFMRFLGYDAVKVKADRLYREGDIFSLGRSEMKVINTPGHTPGSCSLYFQKEGSLFSGDTLFKGDVGRTDFPKGSTRQIVESVREKLFTLPDDTVVYPGHGAFTDIGAEKKDQDLAYLM
jgi:hydroxyacylglutathione hydrolase